MAKRTGKEIQGGSLTKYQNKKVEQIKNTFKVLLFV